MDILWEHQFEVEEGGRALDRAIELNPSLLCLRVTCLLLRDRSVGTRNPWQPRARMHRTGSKFPVHAHGHLRTPGPGGKIREALDQIENTREKFPSWPGWRYPEVPDLPWQDKFEEALALYEEIDPDDLQPHDIARNFTFLVDLGRLDEARALFDEYIAPPQRRTRISSGWPSGSFALGDTAASLAYIQQAEKIDPPPSLP